MSDFYGVQIVLVEVSFHLLLSKKDISCISCIASYVNLDMHVVLKLEF